jgi:hypothetical protein
MNLDEPLPFSLQCKLGSILVHAEEAIEPRGHPFDVIAMRQLLYDPEVRGWRAEMDRLALLPVKR